MFVKRVGHSVLSELRQQGAFLRRWFWLMLLGALITTNVSLVIEHASPPIYQSTATILVSTINLQSITPWERPYSVVSLIQPVIESDAVLTIVQEQYPDQTLAELRNSITVTSPLSADNDKQSPSVNITVSETDPSQATNIANAVAQAVIDFYNDEAREYYQARATTLQAQESQLQIQLSTARQQLQTAQLENASQSQISALQTTIANAQAQYNILDAERNLATNQQYRREQGQLAWISHAQVPANAANRQLINTVTLLAGLAGLAGGYVLALLLGWTDKRSVTAQAPAQSIDPAPAYLTISLPERATEAGSMGYQGGVAAQVFPAIRDAEGLIEPQSGKHQRIRVRTMHKSIVIATLAIIVATVATRLLGVVNQSFLSATYGLGATLDAFFVVQSLPMLLSYLTASALLAATLPVFVAIFDQADHRRSSRIFSTMLNLTLLGTAAVLAILIAAAPFFIRISAPDLASEPYKLAVALAPMVFPIFIFNSLVAYLSSALNVKNQFGAPIIFGAAMPFLMIVGTFIGHYTGYGIFIVALGLLGGTILQFALVLWRARRLNIIYTPVIDFRLPELRQTIALGIPAFLSSLLVFANPYIDQIIASGLGSGVISSLNYALKVIDVLVSICFVPLSLSIFPTFSRFVGEKNYKDLARFFRLYFWLMFIGVSLLGIVTFGAAPLIIRLLFGHGVVSGNEIQLTTSILRGFAIGFPMMGCAYIATRTINALEKNHFLLWFAPFSLALNFTLDIALASVMGPFGIALSTSAVYLFNLVILLIFLRRSMKSLQLFHLADWKNDVLALMQEQTIQIGQQMGRRLQSLASRRVTQLSLASAALAATVYAFWLDALTTLRVSSSAALALLSLQQPLIFLAAWGALGIFVDNTHAPTAAIGSMLETYSPVIAGVVVVSYGWQALRQHPALLPLLAFLAWASLGLLHPAVPRSTVLSSLLVYLTFVGIAVCMTRLTSRSQVFLLLDLLIGVAALCSLYALAQEVGHFGGYQDGPDYRIQSIFSWSESFAFYITLMLLLTAYRLFCTPSRVRMLLGAIVLCEGMALYYTYSRTAEVAVVLGGLTMLLVLRWRWAIAVAATGGVLLLGAVRLGLASHLFDRFGNNDIGTLNGRLVFWQAIIQRFDARDLTGQGLGAANQVIAQVTHGVFASPHNTFLELLYDTGLVGATLFTLALAVPLVVCVWPRARSWDRRAVCGLAASVILSGSLITATTQFLARGVSAFLWILIALPFTPGMLAGEEAVEPQERAEMVTAEPVAVPVTSTDLEEIVETAQTSVATTANIALKNS